MADLVKGEDGKLIEEGKEKKEATVETSGQTKLNQLALTQGNEEYVTAVMLVEIRNYLAAMNKNLMQLIKVTEENGTKKKAKKEEKVETK